MLKSYLLLCLFSIFIKSLHGQQCSDCVAFTSCSKAADLAMRFRNSETEKKFKNSFCGYEFSGRQRIPKVCCSQFDDASSSLSSTNIESHPNVRLLPTSCGDIDGKRIIGGKKASLYEYPWMTLISYDTRSGLQFLCGGSIINSRYILTAAHCVHNKKIAGVRIGENDIRYPVDCQGEGDQYICESHIQDMLVEESIIHESYEGLPKVFNDIALLRLKKPINFSYKNAGPICLPVSNSTRQVSLGGKKGTVAGWGLTETGEDSSVLLKVEIPILTSSECRNTYNKRIMPGERDRTENELCAGELNKDSCNGDSGGPLMLESMYGGVYRIIQYGVVSRGPKQCGSYTPGIYTDVTKFMDWILDHIRE